jgi:organic radical activating enzyme
VKALVYGLSLRLPIAPIRRYLLAMLFYGTVAKVANIVRCEVAKWRRDTDTSAMPFVLALDSVNTCNLRCPYCLTGKGLHARRHAQMDLTVLDTLLDEVGDALLLGNIGNWGEPLLSERVVDVIGRLHARRIFTTVSSNMSFRETGRLERACDAGLDYLIVSADGASQPVYELYRRKGKLDLVLSNVARVLEHRRAANRATPIVEWQFLRFAHNRHEVEVARTIARRLGVDVFRVVSGVAPPGEEIVEKAAFQPRARDRYCEQLWHVVIVNVDGGVAPCCYLHAKAEDFGQLGEQSLAAIRAGERYRAGRALFARGVPATVAPPDHPCLTCDVYLNGRPTAAAKVAPDDRIISRRFAGDRIGLTRTESVSAGRSSPL